MESYENQENERMEIVPLDYEEPERDMLVCNTNTEPFSDTMGGVSYTYEPMVVYRVKPKMGQFAVSRAHEQWNWMKEQARQERREWTRRVDATSMALRETAKSYADENGNPRTKPFPRPGLVDLASPHGKKCYEEGKAAMKALNKQKDLGEPAVPVEHAAHKAEDTKVYEIEKPSIDWEIDRLFSYCERRDVMDLSNLDKSPNKKKGLFKKAMDAFEAFKTELDGDKVKYVVRE